MPLRCLAFLLLAPGLFAQGQTFSEILPSQKEAALGAGMAQRFRERHGTLDAPGAQAYLERVTAELAAAQPGEGPCCTVEIHNGGAEAPAWPEALPGGHIFVPARRFLTAGSERDFVKKLAHARMRDWAMAPEARPDFARPPMMFFLGSCDRPVDVPLGLRDEYDARERRAEEAAERLLGAVNLGTGELERVRAALGELPAPAPRPSLFR